MKQIGSLICCILIAVMCMVVKPANAGPILSVSTFSTIDFFTVDIKVDAITSNQFHALALPLVPFWDVSIFLHEFNDIPYNTGTEDIILLTSLSQHISHPGNVNGTGPNGAVIFGDLLAEAIDHQAGLLTAHEVSSQFLHPLGIPVGHPPYDFIISTINAIVEVQGEDLNITGYDINLTGHHVPEPSTLIIFGFGLGAVIFLRKNLSKIG